MMVPCFFSHEIAHNSKSLDFAHQKAHQIFAHKDQLRTSSRGEVLLLSHKASRDLPTKVSHHHCPLHSSICQVDVVAIVLMGEQQRQ
jgi:hypothetical protein